MSGECGVSRRQRSRDNASHQRWKRLRKLNDAEHLSFTEFAATFEDGEPPLLEAPEPRRQRVRTYVYRDEYGAELFQKVRFALTWPIGFVRRPIEGITEYGDPWTEIHWRQIYPGDRMAPGEQLQHWPDRLIGTRRDKDFRYRSISEETGYHRWRKPKGADSIPYRLPELLVAVEAGETVYWCEGEKDADALVKRGYAATTHHQGAAIGPSAEQAAWLAGPRRVVICADADETGAKDALRRYDLLAEVIDRRRITVACAREGNDVSDHLAAGYAVEELERVPLRWLRRYAKRATPAKVRANGYGPSHEWTARINQELENLIGRD